MTHFAAADSFDERDFTNLQIERFDRTVKIFERNGFEFSYKDSANSPASLAYPDSYGNLVRLGGILYGLGDDVLPDWIEKPEIKPVLSLYSKITFLKKIKKGETLGYGRTFRAKRDSVIATIPIGYQDGYRRSLSNRGRVIVNGNFAEIVGRISMDWTIARCNGNSRCKDRRQGGFNRRTERFENYCRGNCETNGYYFLRDNLRN